MYVSATAASRLPLLFEFLLALLGASFQQIGAGRNPAQAAPVFQGAQGDFAPVEVDLKQHSLAESKALPDRFRNGDLALGGEGNGFHILIIHQERKSYQWKA